MDPYLIAIIIVPPICAGIGYLGKSILDKRSEYLKNLKKIELENVQIKLKNFYYPIHRNLVRENIIWNKILTFYRSKNDLDKELLHKFFWELDNEMLLIHIENQKIIKENIVEIHPDNSLTNSLMKYDEHVTIYNIIRKIDNDRKQDIDEVFWPGTFGSVYPSEILELVEEQLKLLKTKQSELIYSFV